MAKKKKKAARRKKAAPEKEPEVIENEREDRDNAAEPDFLEEVLDVELDEGDDERESRPKRRKRRTRRTEPVDEGPVDESPAEESPADGSPADGSPDDESDERGESKADAEEAPEEPPVEEEVDEEANAEPDNEDAVIALRDSGVRVDQTDTGRAWRVIFYEQHTDQDAAQIHGLPLLKEIWVIGTKISPTAADDLKERAPKARIL